MGKDEREAQTNGGGKQMCVGADAYEVVQRSRQQEILAKERRADTDERNEGV